MKAIEMSDVSREKVLEDNKWDKSTLLVIKIIKIEG